MTTIEHAYGHFFFFKCLVLFGDKRQWIATSIRDDDDGDQIMIRIMVRACHTALSVQQKTAITCAIHPIEHVEGAAHMGIK